MTCINFDIFQVINNRVPHDVEVKIRGPSITLLRKLEGRLVQLDSSLFNFVDISLLVSGWFELDSSACREWRPFKPPDGHRCPTTNGVSKLLHHSQPSVVLTSGGKNPVLVFVLHPLRER